MKPSLKFTPAPRPTDTQPKFRIIFSDSDRTELRAKDIDTATICAVANRIRAKKDSSIMCAFAEIEKVWQPIGKAKVEILLGMR